MTVRISVPPGFNLQAPAVSDKLRRVGILEGARLENNAIYVSMTEPQLSELRTFSPEFIFEPLPDPEPASVPAASAAPAAVAETRTEPEPEPMTLERAEARLAELRHKYSLKDEEVVAAERAGGLPPNNKDFPEWLALLEYVSAKMPEAPKTEDPAEAPADQPDPPADTQLRETPDDPQQDPAEEQSA